MVPFLWVGGLFVAALAVWRSLVAMGAKADRDAARMTDAWLKEHHEYCERAKRNVR